MSRRTRVVLEGVISVAFLIVILKYAGVDQVWDTLKHTDLEWFIPAVAVNMATVGVMAYRWKLLLAAKRVEVSLGWLTRTYFVALFAGQFLPAAIGGDAVRAVELGRKTGDGAEAVASVLIDRLVGVVSLVVLALFAIAIGDNSGYRPEVIAAEALFGLAAALILTLLFSSRLRGVVARTLEPRVQGKRLAVGQRFYEALHSYREHRGTLVVVCVLAMVVQIARIGVIWMLVQALDLPVDVGTVLITGPVVFAALVLPVSLNGIGVREAVFVYFLRDQTTTSEAVALGFAFFAVGTATALVGALVLVVRFVRYGVRGVRPHTKIDEPSDGPELGNRDTALP